MASKTLSAMLLFVMVMGIGLTQVWAKESQFVSPVVLAESIQEASDVELSYVKYQWSGDVGRVSDRKDLDKQGAEWASRLGVKRSEGNAPADHIMTYTAEKRVGKVVVSMSLYTLKEGGEVNLSVKVESTEAGKANAEKQAIERAIQSRLGMDEVLDWTWMVRGNVPDAASVDWMKEAVGALIGEYHDRNTSSYTYETEAGSLQVMLHQDTEGRGEELILGYPAIGSLN